MLPKKSEVFFNFENGDKNIQQKKTQATSLDIPPIEIFGGNKTSKSKVRNDMRKQLPRFDEINEQVFESEVVPSEQFKSRKAKQGKNDSLSFNPAKQLKFKEMSLVKESAANNNVIGNFDGSSSPSSSSSIKDDRSSSTGKDSSSNSSNSSESSSSDEEESDSEEGVVARHVTTQNTIFKLRNEMFSPPEKKQKKFAENKAVNKDSPSNITHNKKCSRKTICGQLADNADKPIHQLLYMEAPPKYDHIELKQLKLKEVVHFLNEVTEYQNSVGITLPVPQLISKLVREQLMSLYRGLNVQTFYSLTTIQIQDILLNETRPKSCISFVTDLQRYVQFPQVSRNLNPKNPADFRIFHNNYLLVFTADFLKWYEIMSEGNEVNIPPLTNKEGGSLKVFLDKIPFEYGIRVFRTITNRKKKGDKFKDIYDFLEKFSKVTLSHYDWCERNRMIEEHFSASFVIPSSGTYDNNYHRNNSSFRKNNSYYPDNDNENRNIYSTNNGSNSYNDLDKAYYNNISGAANTESYNRRKDLSDDDSSDNNSSIQHSDNDEPSEEDRDDDINYSQNVDFIGEEKLIDDLIMFINNDIKRNNNTFESKVNNMQQSSNKSGRSNNRKSSNNNISSSPVVGKTSYFV